MRCRRFAGRDAQAIECLGQDRVKNPAVSCRLKWFAKVVYIYLSDELPGISAFAIFNYLLVTNLLVTFFSNKHFF